MKDYSKDNYWCARPLSSGGYKSRIYHYDSTGMREVKVWESEIVYNIKNEAEDAAVEYADENNIEVEMG